MRRSLKTLLFVAAAAPLLLGQGTFVAEPYRTSGINTTVGPTDCNRSIILTGAFTTLTWPAANTLPSFCRVHVWNANTTRGQKFASLGISWLANMGGAGLFPGQAMTVAAVNGAYSAQLPGRWLVQTAPVLYANASGATVGSFAPGSDACDGLDVSCPLQHLQTAVYVVQGSIDFFASTLRIATIQAACNTDMAPVVYSESIHVFGPLVGGEDFTILGNTADPDSCGILANANDNAVFAKDAGATVTIKGFKLSQTTSGFSLLLVGAHATIDEGNNDFSTATSANHRYAAQQGQINQIGPDTVSGGATNHNFADGAGANIILDGNETYPNSIAFTYIANATLLGGIYFNGGLTFTVHGGVTITASQCTATYNGVVQLASNVLPGTGSTCATGGNGGQVQP